MSLRVRYAVCGTERRYAPTHTRLPVVRGVRSGTTLPYAACSTEMAHCAGREEEVEGKAEEEKKEVSEAVKK
eukprot:492134-Rhodomonas_salina.1